MRIAPGTRALVTGASAGIGRATAVALAERGAIVGLVARREEELRSLAAELPGERHVVLPCDVGERSQVVAALDAFVETAGGLDLLVANAGIAIELPFRAMALEDAERMTQVNWLGTLWTVHFGLPHLLDQGSGHVVVVSSAQALRTFPWASVYGATKAAQKAFAEALRHELSGTGVSLTTVFPGEVATDLHKGAATLPDFLRPAKAIAPAEVAAALLAGVEADARTVTVPREIAVLGKLHAVAPKLSDRVLRALRGSTAAPRRD